MTKEQQLQQLIDEIAKEYIFFDYEWGDFISKEVFEERMFAPLLKAYNLNDTDYLRIWINELSDILLLRKERIKEFL